MKRDAILDAPTRAEELARIRAMGETWGAWCSFRGQYGSPLGRYPREKHGGLERQYRAPPQWHPPEPRPAEPHDPTGLRFQLAFVRLPEIYRRVLVAEFCRRPHLLNKANWEATNVTCALIARMSPRMYPITVDRALLAIRNVLNLR